MSILYLIAYVIRIGLRILYFLLLLRFVISWIYASKYSISAWYSKNWFIKSVYAITDPILRPFEGIFPAMRVDFTPVIVFIILNFFIEPLIFKVILGF